MVPNGACAVRIQFDRHWDRSLASGCGTRWRSLTASASYDDDVRKKINDFCIGTPEGFIPPEGLDFNRLSIEWYLNHSCDGNVGFNEEGDFVAIKGIEPGDELTYDYGLAESNPSFVMACTCGSTICRKEITGNDWKDQDFQARNREHMLPRLRSGTPRP